MSHSIIYSSFYNVNPVWIALILIILLLLATELGFRSSKKWQGRGKVLEKENIGYILTAVLGLLSLLLGFTFSMALDRFDNRRELLGQEANAIGTAFLRAKIMPEPVSSNTQQILRGYINYELEIATLEKFTPEKISEILIKRRDALHQLWKQAEIMGRNEPNQEVVSLFVDVINEVIDLNTSRWAAFNARVPLPIYETLFLIALISMWLTGFYFHERRAHTWLMVGMLSLIIASTVHLIMDLDQGEKGGIQTSPIAMQSLQLLINQNPENSP